MASSADQPSSMRIDLIELETFIAVAKEQSFSAAAQLLHVTQPTVTGRIQRLEDSLGVKLLRRTTRKVETTAQGVRLLTEATQALEQLSHLVHGFRRRSKLERQKVVVAATPSLAASSLPRIIQAYSTRFPDVEIELLDLLYEAVLEAVAEGSADIGVVAFEGSDGHFRFRQLWVDHMVLVTPKDHELAGLSRVPVEALMNYPLLLVGQYKFLRAKIEESLTAKGLQMPPSRVVGNLNTILGMVHAGMGVTLLPRSFAERSDAAKHALLEIEGIDLSRQYGYLVAKRGRSTTAKQSFCRFLEAMTPGALPDLTAPMHILQPTQVAK